LPTVLEFPLAEESVLIGFRQATSADDIAPLLTHPDLPPALRGVATEADHLSTAIRAGRKASGVYGRREILRSYTREEGGRWRAGDGSGWLWPQPLR
jgi:hypothetical protein